MQRDGSHDKQGNLPARIAVVGVILILILFGGGVIRANLQKKALDSEIDSLNQELRRLNLDKQQFMASLDASNSDYFIEKEARQKFNLKKDGEQVVVVPLGEWQSAELQNQALEQANKSASNNEMIVNFMAWWQYFFGARG